MPDVVAHALDGDVAPEHAALLVCDDAGPFALTGRWAGALAIVGSEPVRTAGDPFAALDEQPHVDGPAGVVGGGWFGVFGYELRHDVERLDPAPWDPEPVRPPAVAFYDHLLRLDADGQWWFEALWTEERAAALDRRRALLAARLAAGPRPRPVATAGWRADPGPAGHARAVAACRERIAAGDLYQANLALRLRSELLQGRPVDLFAHAFAQLRPDRAAFFTDVVSLSPELFVTRHGDVVRSAPIKGTRPRTPTARAELLASAKDRAENVMIVDLVRNDLGRVAEVGTVDVPVLAEAREQAGVWHLVSEVVAQLRAGVGDGDLVRALFPPGSVTGAPKIAAMNVISELESSRRHAFCGAIGFASPCAGLELSVTIRTIEHRDGRLWLHVGGGVTADSDPAQEAEECLVKARPLLAAIGGRLEAPHTHAAPSPRRLGPAPVPRPDPSAGVFETLRVEDGRAIEVRAHIARLRRSVAELYGGDLPSDLADRIDAAAAGTVLGRLRVVFAGGIEIDLRPFVDDDAPLVLEPVAVPGGLGAHKWQDRRLLEALETHVAPRAPLLVDLDGRVLETSRANLFAQVGGRLLTPPADGRILPGTARAALLGQGDAAEAPLTLDDVYAAERVVITNALRGVQPAAIAPCAGRG